MSIPDDSHETFLEETQHLPKGFNQKSIEAFTEAIHLDGNLIEAYQRRTEAYEKDGLSNKRTGRPGLCNVDK
jgi:hypothetical protein